MTLGLDRAVSAPWLVLLVLCTGIAALSDTILLVLLKGFLGSGFNGVSVSQASFVGLFLPASLLLDAWFVLCLWAVWLPLGKRLVSPLQTFVVAALLGAAVPALAAVASYNIIAVVGGILTSAINVMPFLEGEESALLLESLLDIPYKGVLVVAMVAGGWTGWRLLCWLERRFEAASFVSAPAPSSRRVWRAAAGLGLLAALPVVVASASGSALAYGFERKLSGRVMGLLLDRVTDVDFDGFGALHRPADPAPMSPDVYPFAHDVPGNGVDENGLAGDHPPGFSWPPDDLGAGPLPGPDAPRPHLLMIYLESFRPDLLEQTQSGRPVAPFLRALAEAGSASEHAFAQAPWTLDSRAHLFTGRLVASPDEGTLIDDFRARGYTVAHFSGQDESYGDSELILGTERAHHFYDARQDVEHKTSRSTAPVSLQVSWQTLCERIDGFLSEWDGEGPLFLYANVVDTHFPYWHDEIENLLGVEPLERSEIHVDNAERVREVYANTAANVDRAVARIVRAFRERIGHADHGILVTADHSQALYEGGLLGHRLSIDESVTRVPFILWGIGGEWTQPLGATDVRPLLLRNLWRERDGPAPPKARFVDDPERRILLYAPTLLEPAFVGLQGVRDRIQYDFSKGRLERIDREGRREAVATKREHVLRSLIWPWEAVSRMQLVIGSGGEPE